MHPDDTIVAVSSASGPAARMIVRTSGPGSVPALARLAPDALPAPATASVARLRFAGLACPGCWVYRFAGPRSYTGEDLVEYHLPGNPVLADLLLRHLRGLGLRPAEAGEFTARAYLNGRLDLTAAEGVAATIAAASEQELGAARRLMAGELARRLAPVMDGVAGTLALLEVGIDFSDEDVTFLDAAGVRRRVGEAVAALRALLAESGRLERLAREPTFVLIGRPNAGKSTLLNALAGYERAVASPAAGTTRDALAADVPLPRGLARVVDVAGLEAAEPQADPDRGTDPAASVRRQMRDHAVRALEEADFVLHVRPAGDPESLAGASRSPDLIVRTMADLLPGPPAPGDGDVRVSALTGEGMDALRQAMDALAFGRGGSADRLALNGRHVEAIQGAAAALGRAAGLAAGPAELCAAELREALDALGEVLGRLTPDDLLGRVFAQFCIGK